MNDVQVGTGVQFGTGSQRDPIPCALNPAFGLESEFIPKFIIWGLVNLWFFVGKWSLFSGEGIQ